MVVSRVDVDPLAGSGRRVGTVRFVEGRGWRALVAIDGRPFPLAVAVPGVSRRMIRSDKAGRHLLPKTVRLAWAGLDLQRAA